MGGKKNIHFYTDRPVPRRSAYRKRQRLDIENERNNRASSSDDEPMDGRRPSASTQSGPTRRLNLTNAQSSGGSDHAGPSNQCPGNDLSSNNESCRGEEVENPLRAHYQAAPGDSSEANCPSSTESLISDSSDSDGRLTPTQGNSSSSGDTDADVEPHGDRNDIGAARVQFRIGEQPELIDNVCPCTTTTEGDILLMVLALAARHNWSWSGLADLLHMINVMFGREVVKDSKYFLMKHMDIGKDELTFHYYCEGCEAYVGTKTTIEDDHIQQCPSCERPITALKSSFFISVDVNAQIKRLLENPQIATEIQTYRFQRTKVSEDGIEDIFDGQVYKQMCESEGLSNPYNFSYTFNTDGVKVTKSSCKSVWPIFLQINELSPQNRRKFMILAGLWVGDKEPNMQLFMNTFVEQANKLSSDGVSWVDELGVHQTSKILPTCLVADSGARYKILNMSSYHSYYGCTFCYQRAVNTQKGRRFPMPESDTAELRTHDSVLYDMREAFDHKDDRDKRKQVVKGTKGPCALITMNHFSFSNGVVVDFMHSVLLGNVRSHFSHLLEDTEKRYYIGSPGSLFTINNRLLSIQTPSVITRSARKLSDCKNWKANEWRCMLLFYAVPCLKNVLRPEYISHLALLSSAVFLLLQNSCSQNDIQLAQEYLLKYAAKTQEYFGITAMRYNIHLLQHIIKGVVDWGPLWTHNAFAFEGQNRTLVQMYSSPFQVGQQICRRFLMFSALPSLCEKYASSESAVDFVENLTGSKLKLFKRCGDVVLSGKGKFHELNEAERIAFNQLNVPPLNQAVAYRKGYKRGFKLSTESYSVGRKHANCYVTTRSGSKAVIKNILLCSHVNNEKSVLLCIQKFRLENRGILSNSTVKLKHIKKNSGEGALCLIHAHDVEYPCVFINLDNERFIADFPFGARGD